MHKYTNSIASLQQIQVSKVKCFVCFANSVTSHSVQDGLSGTSIPLLTSWTRKDVGRGLPLYELDYLQGIDEGNLIVLFRSTQSNGLNDLGE